MVTPPGSEGSCRVFGGSSCDMIARRFPHECMSIMRRFGRESVREASRIWEFGVSFRAARVFAERMEGEAEGDARDPSTCASLNDERLAGLWGFVRPGSGGGCSQEAADGDFSE